MAKISLVEQPVSETLTSSIVVSLVQAQRSRDEKRNRNNRFTVQLTYCPQINEIIP